MLLYGSIPSIQLAIFDVDGVFTNGQIHYLANGDEFKSFHAHDGLGIKRLLQSGITVAIITARESQIVTKRMQELGIKHVFQGAKDKWVVYQKLLQALALSPEVVSYMGDDLPDKAIMQDVILPVAPANAVTAIQQVARIQTKASGGYGAVREFCDMLLDKFVSTPS